MGGSRRGTGAIKNGVGAESDILVAAIRIKSEYGSGRQVRNETKSVCGIVWNEDGSHSLLSSYVGFKVR